jgi:uncharacterized RDD family membrane protein YckC
MSTLHAGLPDPDLHPEFYTDVPLKRLLAFVVDSILIGLITVAVIPFTAFTGLFFLPFLFFLVGLVYRTASLANFSATPGMWLFSIEFRDHRGERMNLPLAFVHTLLFSLWMSMMLPQAVSVILMLTTPRGQGLSDLLLGTAAINRAAAR